MSVNDANMLSFSLSLALRDNPLMFRNFQVAATAAHKSIHFFLLKWDVADA